jgi:tRNA A22 N-methylase
MKEKSETKDLAMTPKEQEMDLRRWCVEVSVKICDKESIIEVAEKLYKWMDAYKQGEEDAKKRAIEILASVLENWVHGGDADCIIAEFEEELMKK